MFPCATCVLLRKRPLRSDGGVTGAGQADTSAGGQLSRLRVCIPKTEEDSRATLGGLDHGTVMAQGGGGGGKASLVQRVR